MPTTLKFKTILTAVLAFFIIACNNKPNKITVQEVKLEDIKQVEEDVEPPPPPPPKIDPPGIEIRKPDILKCFVTEGLSYRTTVTIGFHGNQVAGDVTSEELGSGETETKRFGGTIKGDQLSIVFNDDPPAIGAASEWTGKPWIIKKIGGKEILRIVFNAKNYDSNKWENTPYEFELTDCN